MSIFEGAHLPVVVTYLRISHLPPRSNVPVQRTRRTNGFAAASDKTAMRPFDKLLWTLVTLPPGGGVRTIAISVSVCPVYVYLFVFLHL